MIINILIPDCTRSEHNVFFSILKNVVFRVGHAKLTEHFLDNAFKDGMKAREFQVDLHTAATWNIDSSRRDKILLSKLLGCWASRNCQTFGRILYKEKWETTDSRSVLANNIDKFVYKTLKCILIELDVSESTLTNLKHFVKVPVNEIGLENMVQISPKMKVYQIKNIHWEKCWMSLSRGEWLGSSHGEINNSIPFPSLNTPTQALINSECATTHSSGNSTPLNFSRKRAYGIGIHSQSAMPSMVFECNNTPVNLTSYQSQRNDIRSNGQAQSQPSRSSEPSMSAECNNVTPLDLTSKQSHDNNKIVSRECSNMRMNVNSATTTVIQTTDKELQQRVNLLQDQLLSALQRELDQKNVQLDERNESIAEAQKSIVFLQLQLIDKNSSNNDLRQQLEQQLAAHIESTGKLQDLNDALTKKEESFTETESALRSEIKAKNEILVQLRQENQKLHLKLSEHSETTSATISAQRSEIAATNELLSQTQESKDLLQQQLDAHIESTGKLQDLNDELTKKKESFTETESALRSEIKAKNETLVQLRQENRNLHLKFSEQSESTSAIISAQRSEIAATNELLSQTQVSKDMLQQQLDAHIESTGKLQDLNDELTKKKESFTETESALRSEIKAKNETLVQLRQENRNLHLKFSEQSESTSAIISAQRSEIAATNELLSQTQVSKDMLQQQLDAHIESTGKLQDLNDALTKKEESFTETESALRSEIKAKNETLVQLRQENRNLHLRFSEQSESTSAIISAQRSEIAATNELLSQTQVSKDLLQQQLITRNESVDELSESVKTLQLQLTTKDKSMNEIGNLQYEIQETIKYLESEIITQKLSLGESEKVNQSLRAEMTQKDSSINELQQLVATLKLQLDQKIPHEIVSALSEEATKMSVERVEQTLQPEQQCPPGTLPIVSGIDRHNSRGKIKDQNSRVIVQANVTTRTSSRMRRSKYSKQMSRPRFVQPPDVDDMTRAEEVESEHPSNDK
ncbi:hypothetical protein HA402_014715 [Bradysia odoriphaga]|nr:hypothetical protein HA402_014715 [Bradysia odoriphaga]